MKKPLHLVDLIAGKRYYNIVEFFRKYLEKSIWGENVGRTF